MKVLDVGCGVGGPAREIARFTDCNIVGINNNLYQIGRARKYTEKAKLQGQVTFEKGDFNKLAAQFGENSFDAGASLSSITSSLPVLTLCSQSTPSRRLAMLRPSRRCTARSSRSSSPEESSASTNGA